MNSKDISLVNDSAQSERPSPAGPQLNAIFHEISDNNIYYSKNLKLHNIEQYLYTFHDEPSDHGLQCSPFVRRLNADTARIPQEDRITAPGPIPVCDCSRNIGGSEISPVSRLNPQPDFGWEAGADGSIKSSEPGWHAVITSANASSFDWTHYLVGDDQQPASQRWQRHLASGEPFEGEYRVARRDGSSRWALCRAEAIRSPSNSIIGWRGSFTDIDGLKCEISRLEFLADELNHRIQNSFAVVEGLLMLSSRGNRDARVFAEAASARIKALTQANSYVRPTGLAIDGDGEAGGHGNPSLLGLLQTLLAPYQNVPTCADEAPILTITGSDLGIGPAAASSLALAIHELATNALKHGALAWPDGRLHVDIQVDDDELRLIWTEQGGPAVAEPPVQIGFGTTLIDRALTSHLGAVINRTWAAAGLIMTMTILRDRLST